MGFKGINPKPQASYKDSQNGTHHFKKPFDGNARLRHGGRPLHELNPVDKPVLWQFFSMLRAPIGHPLEHQRHIIAVCKG